MVDGCDRPVGDAYVCQPCTIELEDALADVTWLLGELDVILARQSVTGERAGGPSAEKPLPYDPRATEARWVLVNTITTWARLVDEENPNATLPTAPPKPPRMIGPICCYRHASCRAIQDGDPDAPPVRIGLLAAWLASWSGFLRGHQAGHEAVEEIKAATGAVRRIVDVKPARWYAGPCGGDLREHDGTTCDCSCHTHPTTPCDVAGGCGSEWDSGQRCTHDLYVKPKATTATCPACGALHQVDERREWLMESARDHLATVTEASALCRPMLGELVTRDMIKGYVRRGKIAPHGSTVDRRGREVALYRIGDVIEAANDARFDEREQRATRKAGRQPA